MYIQINIYKNYAYYKLIIVKEICYFMDLYLDRGRCRYRILKIDLVIYVVYTFWSFPYIAGNKWLLLMCNLTDAIVKVTFFDEFDLRFCEWDNYIQIINDTEITGEQLIKIINLEKGSIDIN